jgi:hypothetical protein
VQSGGVTAAVVAMKCSQSRHELGGPSVYRVILWVLAMGCMCQLTACSSAPVGLQKDGTYALDKSEHELACDRLYKTVWGHVQVMRELPARVKAEQEAAPKTAWSAFGRMFGSSDHGLSAFEDYNRERAHTQALHRAMQEKGCVLLDLDRELAQIEAAMADLRKP